MKYTYFILRNISINNIKNIIDIILILKKIEIIKLNIFEKNVVLFPIIGLFFYQIQNVLTQCLNRKIKICP